MEQREFVVEQETAGQRIDRFLSGEDTGLSRSALQALVADGHVLCNGRLVAKSLKLKAGDTIVLEIPDAKPIEAVPQDIPLEIVYEDEHLLVVNKPKGMVVHPAPGNPDGTLVNALVHHCGAANLCNVQGEEADRLGIVHRLDRDTSGLMLAAKTDEAGRELMAQIQDRAVDRHYIALVHGIMAHDTGMIDAPIARSADERCRMAVRDVPSAREAITTFRVLERFEAGPKDDGYSLIECKLFTGRTHQIRVHMQYTRHPIVGDPVYNAHGPRDARAQLGLRRQFLHSYSIAFEHPTTGEPMAFADNLPRDLQEALDSLAARSLGKTEAGREVAELMATSPVPSVEGEVPDE